MQCRPMYKQVKILKSIKLPAPADLQGNVFYLNTFEAVEPDSDNCINLSPKTFQKVTSSKLETWGSGATSYSEIGFYPSDYIPQDCYILDNISVCEVFDEKHSFVKDGVRIKFKITKIKEA